jgi:hypothetical protein
MLALPTMTSIAGSLSLCCHPRTPAQAIRAINVATGGTQSGSLTLTFALEGDLSGVCIPEPRPSRRVDGLWRHTCFEAFVMAGEGPGYREFNFSPSGEWAVYAFRGYRDGGESEAAPGPGIAVRLRGDRLELIAKLRPACLPPVRSLRLGLSAVVEDRGGMLSYWALRHPAGPPDFHHADSFAFQLALPSMHDDDTLIGEVNP